MTMTRFVPFRSSLNDVAVLQNRLNSIFHDFERPGAGLGLGQAGEATETLAVGNFVPAVDVYEDEAKLVVTLEVPGIQQNDLDVRVENQTLTVKGERKLASEEKEENFRRIERRFGAFTRSFTLPQSVDTQAVSARYDAGLLRVEMKKKEALKPRSVKIEVEQATPEAKMVEGASAVQ